MRFGVRSDKGAVREINEDSYNIIAGYSGLPVCFIIADGMGGHNSGEIASKLAVDYASNHILQFPESMSDDENIIETIGKIMDSANMEVNRKSKEDPANSGMGTTMIIAVVSNKKVFIGHIGDSRVYLFRKNEMERITTDHSYIEELINNGSITRGEAENHPKRHVLTKALGCSEDLQIDTYTCKLKDGDVFLLCTDGLTNMISENAIKEIIDAADDPAKACEELVKASNAAGGEDNITVIVFKDN